MGFGWLGSLRKEHTDIWLVKVLCTTCYSDLAPALCNEGSDPSPLSLACRASKAIARRTSRCLCWSSSTLSSAGWVWGWEALGLLWPTCSVFAGSAQSTGPPGLPGAPQWASVKTSSYCPAEDRDFTEEESICSAISIAVSSPPWRGETQPLPSACPSCCPLQDATCTGNLPGSLPFCPSGERPTAPVGSNPIPTETCHILCFLPHAVWQGRHWDSLVVNVYGSNLRRTCTMQLQPSEESQGLALLLLVWFSFKTKFVSPFKKWFWATKWQWEETSCKLLHPPSPPQHCKNSNMVNKPP